MLVINQQWLQTWLDREIPARKDVEDFLLLRKNHGAEEDRARDLFYALWICDRFMTAVEKNKEWYLFSPSDCPGLANSYGEEFTNKYKELVRQKKYKEKIMARTLWKEICRIQIETGTPYILFKDTCNRLSNQKNLGTIRSSNLCCEIIQYSSFDEYAVCNLASIVLSRFLKKNKNRDQLCKVRVYAKAHCFFCKLTKYYLSKFSIPFEYIDRLELKTELEESMLKLKTFPNIYVQKTDKSELEFLGGFEDLWKTYLCPEFDYDQLGQIVQEVTENLNHVIDKSMYPLDKCEKSNKSHRPMGIGVQGLADIFMEMLLPFDSPAAKEIIRHAAPMLRIHPVDEKAPEIRRKLRLDFKIGKETGTLASF